MSRTHADWESAREDRNTAATRYIWAAHGSRPDAPGLGTESEPAMAWLARFYAADALMSEIDAELDAADREAGA